MTTSTGGQEVLNFPDDLLVVRTNFHTIDSAQRQRWELEMQGWFYLHFRLDGQSDEVSPNGICGSYDGECFLLSASQLRPCARTLRGDSWRSVGILCRPSFALANIPTHGSCLPMALQRVFAGDPAADFWCTGRLTSDMRAAVSALLLPPVFGNIRRTYLHAKVVELLCLTVEQLRRAEPIPEGALRLTERDAQCLEEARKILMHCSSIPSLERLARRVGINRSKLAIGFKQLFGLTVGQFHRERRLELARELLQHHAVGIGNIAAAAGYADAGSFSKAFRAHFGLLPSELRSKSLDDCADARKEKRLPEID